MTGIPLNTRADKFAAMREFLASPDYNTLVIVGMNGGGEGKTMATNHGLKTYDHGPVIIKYENEENEFSVQSAPGMETAPTKTIIHTYLKVYQEPHRNYTDCSYRIVFFERGTE